MIQKIFTTFLILSILCLDLKAATSGDILGCVLDDSGTPLAGQQCSWCMAMVELLPTKMATSVCRMPIPML